jgi:hypothetical protein
VTSHIAAIGLTADAVTSDVCDLTIHPADVVGIRTTDGTETPDYAPGTDTIYRGDLTTRTDDEAKCTTAAAEADEVLAVHGWRRTTEWDVTDNAAYAHVTPVPDREEPLAVEHSRRRVESAAKDVRWRRAQAVAYARGTDMAAGALAAAVKSGTLKTGVVDGKVAVDMLRLSYLTGFTGPSLYRRARVYAQAGTDNASELTNAELARTHLAHGIGCRESVDVEVWGRWPQLAGWYQAARWLQERQERHVEAAVQLMDEYRRRIEQIQQGLE